jgi:transposase
VSKPRYSKLTKRQLDKLIQAFILGLPALTAAQFAGVHRNTSTKYYKYIRLRIATDSTRDVTRLAGEIELDESYFGGVRKGKRGRAAAGKQIVFGILERGGQVRTVVVSDVTAATLMDEIIRNTEKGCVYYTDTFRSYNSLSRFGKHLQIDHGKQFVQGPRQHINGIEGFWSYARRLLAKYNGVSPRNFSLYLKEIEWRFNHRKSANLEQELRRLL